MQLNVTYEPDTYRVILNLGGLRLPALTTQALYQAMVQLADKEPNLLASIKFDGSVLVLTSHTDNAGKILASLYTYLHNQSTHRELTMALWFELLEREENRQAFLEWQQLEYEHYEPLKNTYFPA